MWDDLSASEKSELMRIFIKDGIRDLGTMRDLYNEYRSGGSIHIKPENRGKFTALKKRTGKSASWFKAHGTPAQKKMATFALNARKWHHGEGGYLADDDEEYFGDTLPGASVTAYLPDIQSKEGKAIAKNMAERVANGQLDLSNIPRRYYNYVRGEAEGAIPMRGYMDKATNVALGTLAVPLATMAAAEAAPVLAPGNALWSSPIMQRAIASEIGGRAVDLVSKDFTGKTWAENMSSEFNKATGLNGSDTFVGQMAAEMTNPGYLLSPSHFITKVGINRLPQAAFDNYTNRLVKEGFTPNITEEITVAKPIFKEITNTQPYEIADLGGGYMLKSLMRGNPLEKQLSKQGTVNVNNVRALINKGSDIEKTIVDKVLSSEEFANKKAIDYNRFRQAIQDELITYNVNPESQYANYGINSLSIPDNVDVTTNTFTFSSPRIPNGNSKNYQSNTLGHSRTFTRSDEPDITYVMESQSDWSQNGAAKNISIDIADSNDLINTYKWRIGELEQEISSGKNKWGITLSDEAIFDKRRMLDTTVSWLEKELERNQILSSTNLQQASYLSDNYFQRQLQENLKYAVENGQTKLRYPTRNTAIKIEGFSSNDLDDYEGILRRYDNFPKQYKKLFKGADVREVSDANGNTWYEVDVPKDYLKREWVYSTIPAGISLLEGKKENSYANGGPLGDKDTLYHPQYNKNSEAAMYNYLSNNGLNSAQVSGIMGNLAVESFLNSDINQFNGPAYGLIQAEGARKKALKEYQGNPYVFGSGLSPEEQKQLDYIIDVGINNYTPGEWGKKGYSGARAARKAFIDSSDVDEASDIFMKNYLRPGKPHQDRRRKMSNYYFNKYNKNNFIINDSEWSLQNVLMK